LNAGTELNELDFEYISEKSRKRNIFQIEKRLSYSEVFPAISESSRIIDLNNSFRSMHRQAG
jgi:hypothetical protein